MAASSFSLPPVLSDSSSASSSARPPPVPFPLSSSSIPMPSSSFGGSRFRRSVWSSGGTSSNKQSKASTAASSIGVGVPFPSPSTNLCAAQMADTSRGGIRLACSSSPFKTTKSCSFLIASCKALGGALPFVSRKRRANAAQALSVASSHGFCFESADGDMVALGGGAGLWTRAVMLFCATSEGSCAESAHR